MNCKKDSMSQVKKLASETVVYGLGSILPKVLNFLLLAPYLTRVLDQENYGIHGILYAYVALLISIYTLRLETAFFRFATIGSNKEKAYSSGFSLILGFSLIATVLIFINAEFIAGLITKAEDARYIRWFSIILLFDALAALPFAKLRLENRALKFSSVKIINVLITAVMVFLYLSIFPRIENQELIQGFPFYYSEGRDLDFVFLANLVASAFVLLIMFSELLKVKLSIDKALLKKMVVYSSPLILVGVAGAINQVFDRVFVSELVEGVDAVATSGAYNGAAKVAVVMSLFATAFNYAAEPFFFKSFKNKDANQMYATILKAFTIAGCIVFLTIGLFIEQAKYLIGENYWSALNIVPILLMAYLFLGIYYNVSIWYKLKDKTYIGAIIAFAGAIITIASNIILIPRIGYIGASWSALICYFVMCTLAYFTGRKHLKIPYDVLSILAYIIGAAAMYQFGTWIGQYHGFSMWVIIVWKMLILFTFVGVAFLKDRKLLRM